MAMETPTKTGALGRAWQRLKSSPIRFAGKARKLACEDPRRVTHSMKVGLALTLVSIMYYIEPVYKNFEETAIWTVMTVVVVFEFSVGATLSKGLNRAVATLLAGGLGVGAHHLASCAGKTVEPVVIGISVFILATTSTFVRFVPKIKARYDYGMLIFILTFCLISVSGFREAEVLEMANNRMSTVFMGGALCVIVSMCVCPVYAGEELHNLIALNMEKLGIFLEGFGDDYFKTSEIGEDNSDGDRRSLQGYKSILGSKSAEEILANFARWEPRHGKFRFCHPWQQYLKLGTLIRQCAYRIDALNDRLDTNDVKVPQQIREQIEETCKNISSNTGKALKQLSVVVKTMSRQQNPDLYLRSSRNAVEKLQASLKVGSWKDVDLLTVLSCVAVISLLIDVVECTEKVAESVDQLANLAKFETRDDLTVASLELCRASVRIQSQVTDSCPHVVLTIREEPVLHGLPEERGRCQCDLTMIAY